MQVGSNELATLLEVNAARLPNVQISSVTEDSRRVQPGTLFVAAVGERVDGHDFVNRAREAGAVAVMGERDGLAEWLGLPYIYVPHARKALGILAHHLAGDPSRAMPVIGVTGTNGKSSIVFMLRHVLAAPGKPVASFGTLGYWIGDEELDAPHTTPFGEDLASLFTKARDVECVAAVMEVSSHALEQERVAGIDFNVGVFTNLTQDHLDYHQDMESYGREKAKLFERLEGPNAFAAINREDREWKTIRDACAADVLTYGKGGDVSARDVRMERGRTQFVVETPWGVQEISMCLVGSHNILNALAAISVCGNMNIGLDEVARAFEEMPNVPGRFERIDAGQDFHVIVDYAHTEDGLRNVLKAAREMTKQRVIVVFGCGGDRDRSKRPKMAATAAELSDFSIITSDNPRTESPEKIVLDVEMGMQRSGQERDKDYMVIIDRADAIQKAFAMAEPGDLVMIAGKGHEDYQILDTGKIHFDDREISRSLLEAR